MRFFSIDWLLLEDDIESRRVVDDYQRFLSTLSGNAGHKIRQMCGARSLSDALLDLLEVDVASGIIRFSVVAGDNDVGYSAVTIQYSGARLVGCNASEISDAIDRRSTVIRYDEFDVVDENVLQPRYVHRFLLWPRDRKEFGIEFSDLDVSTSALDDRRYLNYGATLVLD